MNRSTKRKRKNMGSSAGSDSSVDDVEESVSDEKSKDSESDVEEILSGSDEDPKDSDADSESSDGSEDSEKQFEATSEMFMKRMACTLAEVRVAGSQTSNLRSMSLEQNQQGNKELTNKLDEIEDLLVRLNKDEGEFHNFRFEVEMDDITKILKYTGYKVIEPKFLHTIPIPGRIFHYLEFAGLSTLSKYFIKLAAEELPKKQKPLNPEAKKLARFSIDYHNSYHPDPAYHKAQLEAHAASEKRKKEIEKKKHEAWEKEWEKERENKKAKENAPENDKNTPDTPKSRDNANNKDEACDTEDIKAVKLVRPSYVANPKYADAASIFEARCSMYNLSHSVMYVHGIAVGNDTFAYVGGYSKYLDPLFSYEKIEKETTKENIELWKSNERGHRDYLGDSYGHSFKSGLASQGSEVLVDDLGTINNEGNRESVIWVSTKDQIRGYTHEEGLHFICDFNELQPRGGLARCGEKLISGTSSNTVLYWNVNELKPYQSNDSDSNKSDSGSDNSDSGSDNSDSDSNNADSGGTCKPNGKLSMEEINRSGIMQLDAIPDPNGVTSSSRLLLRPHSYVMSVYDINKETVSCEFYGELYRPTEVSMLSSFPHLLSSVSPSGAFLWDFRTCSVVACYTFNNAQGVALAGASGAPFMFAGGGNEGIYCCDLRMNKVLYELTTGNNTVTTLKFHEPSMKLFAGTDSNHFGYNGTAFGYDSVKVKGDFYGKSEINWPNAKHSPEDFGHYFDAGGTSIIEYEFTQTWEPRYLPRSSRESQSSW